MRKIFKLLYLSALLFTSCGIKNSLTENYPFFPQGAVLTGTTNEGKVLYIVREEAIKIAGICFIDNDLAVAKVIPFLADSMGALTFECKDVTYSGKMKVRKSAKVIDLAVPKMVTLGIDKQRIRLRYFGKVPEKSFCSERYKDAIFKRVSSEKDVEFGKVFGYYSSKPSDYLSKDDYKAWFKEMFSTTIQNNGFFFKHNQTELSLLLDIYQPENDLNCKRPLLLFIHGGAFFFGDKENTIQQVIAGEVVKKGFVMASINYRLGTSISIGAIERTIYREVQDARAALRYLLHHKEKYGIDEEQIYLAGSSAGGIVALTTAFMEPHQVFSSTDRGFLRLRQDLGGLDDSGNEFVEKIKVKGVISMWGGVTNLQMIDNQIPTLLFHGTADEIVPCDQGLPFKNAMGGFLHSVISWFGKLYGSEPIFNRLQSLGVPVKYVPFEGLGHDPCIEPDNSLNDGMDVIRKEMSDFLYDNVSQHYFRYWISGYSSVNKHDLPPVYKVENLGNSVVQWFVEGGFISHQTTDSIRVIWYDSFKTGLITVCITNDEGISCKKELAVTIS